MSWLPSLLLVGVTSFVITNIDDMLLLIILFSKTGTNLQKRHIILGQYLGFTVLLFISMLGFLGAFIIPRYWIGLLGFYPIYKGFHELCRRFLTSKSETFSSRLPSPQSGEKSLVGALLAPQTYGIATITIGNGADNVSVYIPLFAAGNVMHMILLIILFLVLVGIWCAIGYTLTHHPAITNMFKCFNYILMCYPTIANMLKFTNNVSFPVFLVVLGIAILRESGTLAWFLGLLAH